MPPALQLRVATPDPALQPLRDDVRAFLDAEIAAGQFVPVADSWVRGSSPAFSRKLGARGWLGMTWPVKYGGHGRTQQERYVVIEELLAAGAPVAAHWVAERQIGLSLLRFGTEVQRVACMPAIARGESYFGACYSEPDVGSDLASVRTRAVRDGAGWRITGRKVWTSQAHIADRFFVLARTGDGGRKHDGLTMFMVSAGAPGLEVRPLVSLNGEHHFNEVVLDGVEAADGDIVGGEGQGWKLITAELAIERSGPERILSSFPLLREMVARAGASGQPAGAAATLGVLAARLRTLRAMSMAVAAEIEAGGDPAVQAALVKDLGTRFEGDVVEAARALWPVAPRTGGAHRFDDLLAQALLHAPTFTLRGGTNEVLRGIVARGLGLR